MPLHTKSNERLEFVGDGVLECITKYYLYRRFPKENEGFMTEKKIAIVKDEGEEPEKKAPKPTASVQSAALGGFAQSMNMLFGRSANAGLLEENKRQTDLLKKIEEKTVKQKPAKDPAPAEAVFA
jgi:hypothetical protein